MTNMKSPKCVLCGEKINKGENYDIVGSNNDNTSYYISSDEKLVDGQLCDEEFEEPDGEITLYINGKSHSFDFQDKVVRNPEVYDKSDSNATSEELIEVCDIANSYHWVSTEDWTEGYYSGKKKVGNLVKVLSSYTGKYDGTEDLVNFVKNIWNKKVYFVTGKRPNLFNPGIDVYIEKEDKKEFIKELKENVSDIN